MSTNDSDLSNCSRARRASLSRGQDCLPSAPTTRPNAICPKELGYIWKGSAETQNVHRETVLLDIYWLPSTQGFLYVIEIEKAE
jgi:hypothetical protein